MTDMVIKGTGNSRYLKSVANAMTLYPTYESFIQALIAGTFPIDLNGVNAAGVQTHGTALNKANLLTDALCTALGLATTATPNEAMDKLRTQIGIVSSSLNNVETEIDSMKSDFSKILKGTFSSIGNDVTLTFPFSPAVVFTMASTSESFLVAFSNGYTHSNTISKVTILSANQWRFPSRPRGDNIYVALG